MPQERASDAIPNSVTVLIACGFVLLYAVVTLAARAHAGGVAGFYPWDAGIALSVALLARFDLRWAPLIVAASLFAAFIREGEQTISIVAVWEAVSEAAACLVAALVLRSGRTPRPDLKRVRPVVRLFAAVLLAATLVALSTVAMEMLFSARELGEAFILGSRHFLSVATVLLLFTPLLLVCEVTRQEAMRRSLISIETFLQIVLLLVLSWEVFARFVNAEIHFFYLLFLPLGWIAARHGQAGVVVALAFLYLAPLMSDWFVPHREQSIAELQIRLCVLGMTSLLIGAMGSERRTTQERMLARQAELVHVQRLNVGWEMASALAHEINQPLTAAMNYTQATLRLMAAPSPDLERSATLMRKSLDQIERVGHIIHGLRDFMNKGELRLARTDVGETIEDAIRLVSAEAGAAGVDLDVSGFGHLPTVMADKTQLVQILVNLLRNAIQALSTSKPGTGLVKVSGRSRNGNVEITVADNGRGVAPEVRERLFEPFVTTKSSGMGLGLSISQSIAEAHHGQLTVESLASGGTAFHIILPSASQDSKDA